MKTDIQTFKAADLLARLCQVAPSIEIQVLWSHDPDLHDITKDCDMPDDTDPDDWQAWQSEVQASAIVAGKTVSGSAYLGGTWEKFGDHPSKSNPEISGYLPSMVDEALRDLLSLLPAQSVAACECLAALEVI
jgi:hypothetical protein